MLPTSAKAGVWADILGFLNPKKAEAAQEVPVQSVQTMPLLHAATNFDPNPSKGGGETTIVDDSALLSEEGPSGTMADITGSDSHMISVYVVREGDTLSQIAKLFGVTTNTILWANDLPKGTTLKQGMTLTILPISGVGHTVRSGDTLAALAKKFNADAEEIAQFNGLDAGNGLAVGSEILIPNGEIAAPVVVVKKGKSKSAKAGSYEPLLVNVSALPSRDGYFIRPVVGGIKTQGLHGFNGVDLASQSGAPILAAAGGSVIISRQGGWNGGYGNYVVIKHDNGSQTLYGHMLSTITSEGQEVVQGQVIGYMGNTGKSTGTHLHFEIRGAKNPF